MVTIVVLWSWTCGQLFIVYGHPFNPKKPILPTISKIKEILHYNNYICHDGFPHLIDRCSQQW